MISYPYSTSTAPANDILSPDRATGTFSTQRNENIILAHGATGTIVNYSGNPGYLQSFSLQMSASSNDNTCFTNSTIQITVDGEATPSTNMPLADFLQSHYLCGGTGGDFSPSFSNAFFGFTAASTSNGRLSCWCKIPMPFSNSLLITVTNGSSANTTQFFSMAELQTKVPNTWPGTKKFQAVHTQFTASRTINTAETYANAIATSGGRYLGFYWLNDSYPGTMSPAFSDLEGNIRLYLDTFNSVWASGTAFGVGQTIIDSNGNLQTVASGGTSGASALTWGQTLGGTTTDGTVTWKMSPGDATTTWQASKTWVQYNHSIIDSNGNLQYCTTSGAGGSSVPSWSAVNGGTTADSSAVWTCQTNWTKAAYNSSGTEDYWGLGFYFANTSDALTTTTNQLGFTGASNYTGLTFYFKGSGSACTVGAYRFHLQDSIKFNSAIALLRQNGDSSEATFTGYSTIYGVVYYYTG